MIATRESEPEGARYSGCSECLPLLNCSWTLTMLRAEYSQEAMTELPTRGGSRPEIAEFLEYSTMNWVSLCGVIPSERSLLPVQRSSEKSSSGRHSIGARSSRLFRESP